MPSIIKATKFATYEDEKNDTETQKKVVVEHGSDTGSFLHLSALERMILEINRILDTRSQLQVLEKKDDEIVDVTPKPLQLINEKEGFMRLTRRFSSMQIGDTDMPIGFSSMTSAMIKSRVSKGMSYHASIDDILRGIGTDRIVLEETMISWTSPLEESAGPISSFEATSSAPARKHLKQYIRIVLRKTELQLLYEQNSITTIKGTDDGILVEKDNKEYDHLTIGRGKMRRRSEAEAQTPQILIKSRATNTKEIKTRDVPSYVSYFEMFDTYKMLDDIKYNSYQDESKKLHISATKSPEEQFNIIVKLPSFNAASVIIKRLLAGNTFEKGQRRFRSMEKVTRTVKKINYKYSIHTLFTIDPANINGERRAVADMSFCPTNSDILAVGYGIYTHQAAKLPLTGEVCVWSIKNPCDPERFYTYSTPVVSLEFSPFTPTLLAVGLFDGSVEVRDIAYTNHPPVAVAKRTPSSGVDPVLDLKWIRQSSSKDFEEIDPFLALSQDGSVTQYRIINSPFLASVKLMTLERLEGQPEGLVVKRAPVPALHHSSRSPQGLSLAKHPVHLDIYYILTDEGCIQKCSTNYQHHYIQALKTHEGSVNHMDFSPWSPKLFLTCGNDWCVRIWMDGILEPLITLKNSYKPYNWAAWSRTHSTMLLALNRNDCEIWDLRRNTLIPMSIAQLDTTHNTTAMFSLDGTCILIGTERGHLQVNALDDMPFPSYYQYDALEKAIYKAVSDNPELLIELKSVGFFGYPDKKFVKPG